MRTWNKPNSQGNLFSCTLKDQSGSIRATAFKEDADRLYKDLQVGKTYIITRGSIKPTNKRYDNTGHEYEITFGRDTTVQEVQSGGFAIEYAFKKIAELETCEPNTTIDIIGVATEIGEVVEITSRKDGRLLKKRDVTVLDDSNASVGITLWGGTAESFEGEAPGAPPPVVVVRKARVSDWNGRSLSMGGESSIVKCPDITESHAMRSWYDSTGHAAETKNMSAGGGAGGGGARGPNTENRKTFEFAKAEGVPKGGAREVNLYNNVATITYFKHDGTVAYPSCPETKKKLVEINENCWRCEATGKEYPEPQWRYCMSMKAEDSSGHSWVTAFDDTAKMILGVDAKQMMELKNAGEADPAKQAEFAAVFDNVVGTDFVFRCVLKEDTYQDETRLKTSLLAADKMDYAAESRHILSTFKAAGICA